MAPDDFTEKIDLLVSDENRIVTYKILSHELKIHVNKAKQCLVDFVNFQKSKGVTFEIHYFLAGFTEKDEIRSVKVLIVPEDRLEDAKKSFSELTSFHIYSIYKGTAKDECALYSADFTYIKDKEGQNKYSAIKHPNIEIQPPVLNKMQINSDKKINFTKKVESKPPVLGTVSKNSESKPVKKVAENGISPEKSGSSPEKKTDSVKEAKTSPDAKKQKSGTLMSMWQKKEEKSNGVKKDSSKTEVKGKEAGKAVPKNNILSMFSKQAVKNAEKPPVSKSSVSKNEQNSTPAATEVLPKKDSPKIEKTTENKKTSQKRKMSNKQSRQNSKSKNDSDSDSEFQKPKAKKHRRICTFDDSSESENEEEKEKAQRSFFLSEEPTDTVAATPMSEDEEPIPPTPPVIHVKGKAKVWKTVQKTFEDEEGFFVTKTEKELVSASEDEEDPLKNKPVKKEEEIINKKSNSVNKKQASLMSFFKQK